MNVNEAFPSPFLKAEDLQGKQVTVTIEEVSLEEIGQGRDKAQKVVITFKGKEKKLVTNKTNCKTIAKLYGDDTDAWIGQRITLVAREVEFGSEMVWAIRVSLQKPGTPTPQAAKPKAAARPAAPPPPEEEEPPTEDGEDCPPF